MQISAVANNKMMVKIAACVNYKLCSYVIQTTVAAAWFFSTIARGQGSDQWLELSPCEFSTVMEWSASPCLVNENAAQTLILCSTI